jgi:hypothetical protein
MVGLTHRGQQPRIATGGEPTLSYIFIPMAIFGSCCLAQFWFMYRVRDALVTRHPDEWLKMSKRLFFSPLPWGFVWSGRHRELNDPILSRRVFEMRALSVAAYVSWAALAIGVVHHY